MAAVETTIFLGVLAILSVLAYVFILRKMKTKQLNQADTAVHAEPTSPEVNADYSKVPELQESNKKPKRKPMPECSHHFGYLSSLPKNRRPPSECLQCRRKTQCLERERD